MQSAFAVLLILAFAVPQLQAQECNTENREMAKQHTRLADFVSLLSIDFPKSCGDLNPFQLVPCRNEIDVVSGCCVEECKAVFESYSAKCLKDLTKVLCENEKTAPAVAILNRMVPRCDDDKYVPLECENASGEKNFLFGFHWTYGRRMRPGKDAPCHEEVSAESESAPAPASDIAMDMIEEMLDIIEDTEEK